MNLNGRPAYADVSYTKIYGRAKKLVYLVDNCIHLKTLRLLFQLFAFRFHVLPVEKEGNLWCVIENLSPFTGNLPMEHMERTVIRL